MSDQRQWLEQGLAGLPPARAQRVRLFRLLVMAGATLRNRLERELAPSGVTVQQGALLQYIESQQGPPTIKQVAQALATTHQNVKQIALALERKGFLAIEVDEADRRARRLRLTTHHRRFWQQRNRDDFRHVEAWTAALDDAQAAELVALLRRLFVSWRDEAGSGEPPATMPTSEPTTRKPG